MTAQAGPSAVAQHGGDAFAQAHAAMLADKSLQFQFTAMRPQPPPPDWMRPLVEALQAVAPLLQYVFWGGVIIVVGIIVYALARELARRMPSRTPEIKAAKAAEAPAYRPTAARARALLEEADRLAGEGRYGEAARVLLHRSIEDLERIFTLTIGPALTSREIVSLEPLSAQGRNVFGAIAQAVETSLFGGQPLSAARFAECREAYAAFAFKGGRR
jgi:hypothetical protein